MDDDFSRGFHLLLADAAGMRVLEVSADDGERATALGAIGAQVTALRASAESAARLVALGFDAAVHDAAGSTSGAADFDAALLSLALGRSRGSEWVTGDLSRLVSTLVERIRPGGTVALAIPNPLSALPLLGSLFAALGGGVRDRPARGRPTIRMLSERRLRHLLEGAGLSAVRVFTPIPDARRPKFLVPLGNRDVLDYFFANLVPRPRSALKRSAIRGARLAARIGILEPWLPSYEVVARVGRG